MIPNDARNLEDEIIRAEDILVKDEYDFSAKYLALRHLHSVLRTNPEIARSETILALNGIFHNSAISNQTQSFFLFREAAKALCFIAVNPIGLPLAGEAYAVLSSILRTMGGNPHRAAAEALGSLPVSICGPEIKTRTATIPRVNWQEVLDGAGAAGTHSAAFVGRSIVRAFNGDGRLLIVKLALAEDSPQSLYKESLWLKHLCSDGYFFPVRFNIPVPIEIQGSYLFRLENGPACLNEKTTLHPEQYGIGFISHRDYFNYPNDHRKNKRLAKEEFKEVIFRNAFLFGKLTSWGVVHSAPIPLFHNRVQGFRRRDNGLYEWQRGGRLDRWLDSCRYPNFGLTGIRDLEHLLSFKGSSRSLYGHMGTQLLSLFLVAGSYFRNKDRSKIGFDRKGNPIDVRDLFDKQFLKEVIGGIFGSYYHGFVGKKFHGILPLDFDALVTRMVDEMGVDTFMEEILRVVDQREMTDKEFASFLEERGYSEEAAKGFQKGLEEITIHTGPHLGGFNQRTSLPELIESVGTMSALCIFGRYCREKRVIDHRTEIVKQLDCPDDNLLLSLSYLLFLLRNSPPKALYQVFLTNLPLESQAQSYTNNRVSPWPGGPCLFDFIPSPKLLIKPPPTNSGRLPIEILFSIYDRYSFRASPIFSPSQVI